MLICGTVIFGIWVSMFEHHTINKGSMSNDLKDGTTNIMVGSSVRTTNIMVGSSKHQMV